MRHNRHHPLIDEAREALLPAKLARQGFEPTYLAGANIPMYNAAFGNASGSLPHTAIVNQQRLLSFTHTGEITEAELRTEIDRLLGQK